MNYIGIDVGKNGGITCISPSGIEAHSFGDNIIELIKKYSSDDHIFYVEQVHAMPGNGVVSMFSFGKNAGYYEGILNTLNSNYIYIRPQKWQKGLNIEKSKGDKAGHKRKLKELAISIYPNVEWTLKTCDSGLIAHYAKLMETK